MPKSPSKPKISTKLNPVVETPPALIALPNATLAFCDGACKANPGRGGFGTVIILPNGEQIDIYGGEVITTNNRMELMGAIMALAHSPTDIPIQIWTDSSYVKNGITEWIKGWQRKGWKDVKNVDLWQQLDQARQHRPVTWHWLKGHAGHEGNEYADTLANLGVANLPAPLTIKHSIKKTLLKTDNDATPTMTSHDLPQTIMANNPTNNSTHVVQPPTESDHSSDDLMGLIFSDTSPQLDDDDIDVDASFSDNWDYPQNYAPNYDTHFNNGDYPSANFDSSLAKFQAKDPAPTPAFKSSLPHQPVLPIHPLFQDSHGVFFAQDEALIAQRPEFDGNTQTPNVFIPLLPLAKNHRASNRQLIMDTETTGFEATGGDRIVEIGIVELIDRKPTGEKLHVYINPNKEMGEEVIRIHGISNAFLADKPRFEQIGNAVYTFMLGAELVAHNASFDMGFLVAEFGRMGIGNFASQVSVIDSLAIAKQQYAGQRNTLDALVKRLNVGKQDRTFHGALLDAEILAEVYLAMTGGQVSLGIDDSVGGVSGTGEHTRFNKVAVARFVASERIEQSHLAWINALKAQNPKLLERWGLV